LGWKLKPMVETTGGIMKRFATKYPGVFYREADRIGGPGKEKVFYVVFKKEGKVYEEKAGRQYADDMTAAKAARYRGERIEGKRPSPKEIRNKRKEKVWTINALWEEYKKAHSENKGLKIEDGKFSRHIKDGLGRKKPEGLSPLDIDRLRVKLQKEGKHTTTARVLELLRRSINFGINRTLIKPLPFKIKIPTLNNQVTEDLSPPQLINFMDALDKDEDQLCANLFRLVLNTGMRRGEVFKLKWSDIDHDRGFIHIRDPKGGPDQIIPLTGSTRGIFEAIPKESEFVFPGKKPGTHLKDMRKSITRIKKNAGLPSGFRPLHGLRHVYASMLASSGEVDMYTLQKLLTHKSPAMTQRYAHLRDDSLKRAADVAADIISNIGKKSNEKHIEKSG
jgi:integrase